MWLVIVYAVSVGAIMRYLIMPALKEPASVLWSLPLLLIVTIPPLHRLILSKFADRYTFGNWFRASFLYTFTWLAVCFILVNPPLADISPPEVANKVVFIDLDDPDWNQPIADFEDDDNVTERRLGLAFAVRDNIDANDVEVRVDMTWLGDSMNWTGTADSMRGDWDNYADNVSKVSEKSTDVPIFIEFPTDFEISSGVPYTIEITLTQDGDPWVLEEVHTIRFSVEV